jgi:hypothetical protein
MLLTRRLGAAAVALAVGAGLALTMSPTAQAATKPAVATTTTVKVDTTYTGVPKHYGDTVFLDVQVTGADGQAYLDGTVKLYECPVGTTTGCKLLDTGDGFVSTYLDLKKPVQFYADYLGAQTSPYFDPQYDTPYSPSTSSATPVVLSKVGRGELLVKNTKKKVCYKVGPKPYKNKPVYHYYRIGKKKKWHFGYTEHTNKKSQICWKPVKLKKVKHVKKTKGPKITAEKTVYVKSGGMKKTTVIDKF